MGLKEKKTADFAAMVKKMMGKALLVVGAENLIRERSAMRELDFLLTPEEEIVDVLKRLETSENVQIKLLYKKAADLCFLAYFSRPGQGIRAEMLPVKGKLWKKAIQVAGARLWKASGELVSPFAIADEAGIIRIGSRDKVGNLPSLPDGTLLEQRTLAKEGVRTAMGIIGKYPFRPVSIFGALENWKKALERVERLIKEERNS